MSYSVLGLAASITVIVFLLANGAGIKILEAIQGSGPRGLVIDKDESPLRKLYTKARKGKLLDIPYWFWPIVIAMIVAGFYVFGNPVTSALCGLACAMGPSSIYRTLSKKEVENELACLPSAISVISGEYASHSSLSRALQAVGETIPAPVGPVFAKAYREYSSASHSKRAFRTISDGLKSTYAIQLADLLAEMHTEGERILPMLNDLADDVTATQRLMLKQKTEVSGEKWFTTFVTFLPIVTFLGLQYMLPDTAAYIMATFLGRIIVTLVMASIVIWFFMGRYLIDEEY